MQEIENKLELHSGSQAEKAQKGIFFRTHWSNGAARKRNLQKNRKYIS